MRLSGPTLFLALVAVGIGGCGKPAVQAAKPENEAETFLKWSMNQNAALKSYQATVAWSTTPGPITVTEKRQIQYERPNKYHLSSAFSNGESMSAISNGTKAIEIADMKSAATFDAPATISTAEGMQIVNPVFNGSLLYQFFAGSDNYDAVVDATSGKIEFGDQNIQEPGETAKTVKFHGSSGFGNVEVVIGSKTGLIYKISYDGLPGMLKNSAIMQQYGDKPPQIVATEVFSDIKTGTELAANCFDPTPPKGVKVQTITADGSNPPVPIGKPAPDVTLTGLDGKKVKLSSFRGKIVLIDFWATWCPPCRESLPITNKFHETYSSKGLQVLTVSTEDAATISAFLKTNKYTFPAYRDPKADASRAYNVDGIPCTIIVDAKGNLSGYLVGLRPEAEILESLKKAGLQP